MGKACHQSVRIAGEKSEDFSAEEAAGACNELLFHIEKAASGRPQKERWSNGVLE
jgi:hypothetical protein